MELEKPKSILCQNLITKYALTNFYNCFNYRSSELNYEYEMESKLLSNPKFCLGLFETDAKYKINNQINFQSFTAKITQNHLPKFINNVVIKYKSFNCWKNVTSIKVEVKPIDSKENFINLDRTITLGLLKREGKCLLFLQHVFSNYITDEQRKILNRNIDLVNKKIYEVNEFFKAKENKGK